MTWNLSRDGRIERLIVFVDMDGVTVPVGALTFEGKSKQQSYFAYASSWLDRDDKFALAPTGLPMKRKAIVSTPHAVPLPFHDAAPDGWGRSVLTRAFPNQEFGAGEFLAAAADDRTGYFRFGPTPQAGPAQWIPDGKQMLGLADGTEDLEELVKAAEAADIGEPTETQLQLLFRSSTDIGGARPKARVRRRDARLIAKFRAWGDAFDDPKMEAVCLSLAQEAGIEVPQHEVVEVAGRSILLVRRFDRTDDGARLGYVSAGTLMGAKDSEYRTDTSYADIAAKARQVGIEPCEAELFRRLLFNAFVHNTDDHLRNHAFIRRDGHWTLSPAFDLVPSRQAGMVLRPGDGFDPVPDPVAALDAHDAFLMDRSEAEAIYADVASAMRRIGEFLDHHQVSARDRQIVSDIMPFAFNPPPLKAGIGFRS